MQKIAMVDLKRQYEKIRGEIDHAIQDVIDETAFINGPAVKKFKEDLEHYLDVKHVIPCANGTDALQVAMMALDLKPGDEVIAPSFTFIATAEVISLLGLTPVLVDVDPDTFNIDPAAVEKAITPKTKAIVPVHLFGQCADMNSLLLIAEKHGLFIIEDNAQAIGADYTLKTGRKVKAGTMGQLGCTSFFPSKNLGCYGDGGAIFTNDDQLADRITAIVNHGMRVRYYHDEIGVNSRLDSIQAAILRVKLKYLDEYASARQKAADQYDQAFKNVKGIKIPARNHDSTHVFHQYTLLLEGINRNELREYLAENDIPAMIYYPVPLHKQKAYLDIRYQEGDFPVSEKLSESVISLPMHTELDEEQIEFIITHILKYINHHG